MNSISARLLQDSIEGTANQFQRDREFTDAKANRERDDAMRRELLENTIKRQGLDDTRQTERDKETARHHGVMEGNTVAKGAMDQKKLAKASWMGVIAIGKELFGKSDPSKLPAYFQGAASKLPPETLANLKDDPAFLATTDSGLQVPSKEGQKDPGYFEVADNEGNIIFKGVKTSTGTVHPGNVKPDPMDTIVEKFPEKLAVPAVPAVPAKKNWFSANDPAVPEIPAQPYEPARNITRHVPHGQLPAPAALSTPPPPPAMNGDFGGETPIPAPIAPLPPAAPVQSPTLLGTPPAPNTNGAPAAASDQVMMIHPNGQKGYMPRANVGAALAKGYKLAQ